MPRWRNRQTRGSQKPMRLKPRVSSILTRGTLQSMLEIIFQIGSFELKTLTLLQVAAVFVAAFIFWRRGKEEHYAEAQLFDSFISSSIFGLLMGRLVFVAVNWSNLGFNLLSWLDIWSKPGMNLETGLIAAGIYLFRFAQKKKWDAFEVMDFWVSAISLGMVFLNLGHFFDGSNFGTKTSLPWGMIFPSVFEKHHPTQIYAVIFYAGFYYYLNWLEYNYRTFEWYRAGKKTAETGFLLINFLIIASLFELFLDLLAPASQVVMGVAVGSLIHGISFFFGVWLLLKRSHRVLFSFSQKKFLAIRD